MLIWLMLFAVAAGLAALAGAYRLFIGPSATDRVIGLDLLFAVAIIFCLIAAWTARSRAFACSTPTMLSLLSRHRGMRV